MRRLIGLVISGLAVSGLLNAQTLNVQVGNVTYRFPAAQTYSMPYENGETLTIMGKEFALSEIDHMFVDETAVTDGSVQSTTDLSLPAPPITTVSTPTETCISKAVSSMPSVPTRPK